MISYLVHTYLPVMPGLPTWLDTLLPTWVKPLWLVALLALDAVILLVLVRALLRRVAPKVAAIAATTAREAFSQPLFYLLVAIGVAAFFIFPFVPYNTFGEDIKFVKDEGLTLIMVLTIVLAVWTASISVAEEIDGRTALTLLSKPIGRRQFILGKFLGVLFPVVVMFIILGMFYLPTVSYKVPYDAFESAQPEPSPAVCLQEMVHVVPGLGLAFYRVVIFASIAVAISTRLPMLPNLMICGTVYVLGHLIPLVVASSVGQLEYVRFAGNLAATILPGLDHFSMNTAIFTGDPVPPQFLLMAGVYCILYSTVAMLVALLLFEDRDLA